MAKTINEIAVGVLEELGRLADGQVAPASQTQKVKAAYKGLYEDLFNNSLVDWGPTEAIPEYAVYPIEQLVASRVAGKFGVSSTKYDIKTTAMRLRLAENITNPAEEETTPMTYF